MTSKAFEALKKELTDEPKVWLITGVAGFIGSHLLETLLVLNQYVVGIDNFSTGHQSNLDEVSNIVTPSQWSNFRFINGDIRNIDDCRRAMKFHVNSDNTLISRLAAVDYVLHEAALGSVPRSIEDPIATNQNNIDGFLNILVAAREANIKRLVYAASSSSYGDEPSLPKVEDKIGNPLSPYAVTKLVNELYADVFARVYGFKSIGLRYFNVFGSRQDPNGAYAAVIPRWISSMIQNKDIYINGDGNTSRDFCYVKNVIQANLLAATSQLDGVDNQIYNVSVGERNSLVQLYEFLRTSLSPNFPHLVDAKPEYREFRSGDILHSQADISKISKFLGYRPTHRMQEGLREAIGWYIKAFSEV